MIMPYWFIIIIIAIFIIMSLTVLIYQPNLCPPTMHTEHRRSSLAESKPRMISFHILQPYRILVCYWRANHPGCLDADAPFPCLIIYGIGPPDSIKDDYYGIPALEYPDCAKVCSIKSVIARFMGPTWGPSGADRTQVGPMLAPWTLLSGIRWSSFELF